MGISPYNRKMEAYNIADILTCEFFMHEAG